MKASDLEFSLPDDLIAQDPIQKRDQSRLMVMDRNSGDVSHKHFYDIIEYLLPGDVLICNDTRVIPARLFGKKRVSGGKIEVLLLSKIEGTKWYCLTKSSRALKENTYIDFNKNLCGKVIEILDDGRRVVEFFSSNDDFENIVETTGKIPLPPYIKHDLKDPERYQTVYSLIKGSVASPTAGLHFTDELLDKIRKAGVDVKFVTLHISLDTFKLIETDDLSKHPIFKEYCELDEDVARSILNAKKRGNKVFATGTTVTRTIETASKIIDGNLNIAEFRGYADIFITPGYQFKVVDALITNFHLPRSTPLSLVSAFSSLDKIKSAYSFAIEEQYKFYSFGDAMLIL